jgi:uncharacterized protein GlcG (DUF336 family)
MEAVMIAAARALALIASVLLTNYANAQDGIVTYKSLSPELALDLARAALGDCRKRGYQVAVAVVDRFGVTQVLLRDRFAGPHTVSTALGKAWTAVTFRTNTTELNAASQPGMMQAGIRALPGVVVIGAELSKRPVRCSVPSAFPARRAATPTIAARRLRSTRSATGSSSSPRRHGAIAAR